MGTLVTGAGPTLILARLGTILLVNHGTGGDLSATGQVSYADYPHPEIVNALPFVTIGPARVAIERERDAPLNQYTHTMRCQIEGWAPVTSTDVALGRMLAAHTLADHVVDAIQLDFASDSGSNTLFDLLVDMPSFEVEIHAGSVRNGSEYGRFTIAAAFVYRRTSGL